MEKIAIRGHASRGEEIIKYLESLGGINHDDWTGDHNLFYYYIDSSNSRIKRDNPPKEYKTFGSLEELLKQTNKMRILKPKDAQRIIDAACNAWKPKLAEKWAKSIVLNEDIEVSEDFYKQMRSACTSEQHALFDEIFGKDIKFKKGDKVVITDLGDAVTNAFTLGKVYELGGKFFKPDNPTFAVIKDDKGEENGNVYIKFRHATEEEIKKADYYPDGTPCLVRNNSMDGWNLRYANGNGRFYVNGRKSGDTTSWLNHMKLDMNNLPVN